MITPGMIDAAVDAMYFTHWKKPLNRTRVDAGYVRGLEEQARAVLELNARTLTCPICPAPNVAILVEKWTAEGLYLAHWRCNEGHEWSERSKPWGTAERQALREGRTMAIKAGR